MPAIKVGYDKQTIQSTVPPPPSLRRSYLGPGGIIEHAQQIANHASPQTTRLYDRSSDEITLDEVERIVI